jgi:hypothetical protein
MSSDDAPTGEFQDNSYVSRPGQKAETLAVQSDNTKVEDPIDPNTADTDEQLGTGLDIHLWAFSLCFIEQCPTDWHLTERDDNEAIDRSNILDERTRHATQKAGTYREPGDDEGLPADDGTSRTRWTLSAAGNLQ